MKFKIVTLDCPYDQWDDSVVQDLFVKNVSLKFRGYKKEYPYGVLPVDTTDFVGVHHILCEVTNDNKLQPIMAYRSIYSSRCKTHNLTFPALTMVKSLNLSMHTEAVSNIIENCEKNNLKLSYDSSWTIDPDFRKNKLLTQEVRKIMNAMHVLYHVEEGTDQILSGGVLKFKMDVLFHHWGYQPISLHGKELEKFGLPMVFNEEIIMFHQSQGFTEKAVAEAKYYIPLWKDRLFLKPKISTEKNIIFEKQAA